jgi:hypothetical protein
MRCGASRCGAETEMEIREPDRCPRERKAGGRSPSAAGSVDRRSARRCRAGESGWSAMAADQVFLSAPAEQPPLRSAHEDIRRARDGPQRVDLPIGAAATARFEESPQKPLVVCAGPRWRASVRWRSAPAVVTSAWSPATLPRVASGRLGRSPVGCDPYQPFRRCGRFSLCPGGDELEACST